MLNAIIAYRWTTSIAKVKMLIWYSKYRVCSWKAILANHSVHFATISSSNIISSQQTLCVKGHKILVTFRKRTWKDILIRSSQTVYPAFNLTAYRKVIKFD
jgi:hypothetical protein